MSKIAKPKETGNNTVTSRRLYNFLGSNFFFKIIVGIFLLQAIWFAISAVYPMLYDEYYHPGVVDYYSNQSSPIIDEQPAYITARYGDLTRNPSYMYHYLMSFPYRIIDGITDSFYVKIITLRLINVAFFAVGLILLKKLLMSIKMGHVISNVSILLFIMLPLTPYLSAHINYDNLLFALSMLFFLLSVRVLSDTKISFTSVSWLITIGMFTSLVKQAFLPIFLAAIIYILIKIWLKKGKSIFEELRKSLKQTKNIVLIVCVVPFLLIFGLFLERSLGNVLVYGSLNPSCKKIQPAEVCNKQQLVVRNITAEEKLNNSDTDLLNPFEYVVAIWIPKITSSALTVEVNRGAESGLNNTIFTTEKGEPLLLTSSIVIFLMVSGVLAMVIKFNELKKIPHFWYFASIIVFYLFWVIIMTNYRIYLRTGEGFAIQSRYLIMVIPILIAFSVYAANRIIGTKNIKIILLSIVSLCLLITGGASTYLIRSNDSWYWQRKPIIEVNSKIRDALKNPLIY